MSIISSSCNCSATIRKKERKKDIQIEKLQQQTMEMEELRTPSPIPQVGLPQHLITSEILARLPIKSLIRFKSVSKEWKSIISSSHLARLHLHFQRSSPNHSPKLLLVLRLGIRVGGCVTWHGNSLRVFDYAAYDKGGNPYLYEIDPSPDGPADVLGCSDGLVLLAFWGLHIWNPATRESCRIPSPGFSNDGRRKAWGFGYVPSIDDYKVVSLSVESESDTDDNYEYEAKAFTLCLKAGNWKQVGFYVPHLRWGCHSRAGVLVNEKLYWLLRNTHDQLCIVGFDLASEEFTELDPPQWMKGQRKGHFLSVIDGCLCFCSFNESSGRVDISMLKEQGGSTSWVKFYRFCNVIVDPFDHLNVSGVWSGRFMICTSAESTVLVDMNQDPPVSKILMTSRSLDLVQFYYLKSLASPFGVVGSNTKDDGVADTLMESPTKVGKIKPWVVVVHAIILVISIAFAMTQLN